MQHILHGELVWVSKEEEEQLWQDANRQRIIPFARSIVGLNNQQQAEEQAQNQTQDLSAIQ